VGAGRGGGGRGRGAAARLLFGAGGGDGMDTPDEGLAHAASDAFDRVRGTAQWFRGGEPISEEDGLSDIDRLDMQLQPSTMLSGVFLFYSRLLQTVYGRSFLLWEGGDWPEPDVLVDTYGVGQSDARPLPVFVRFSESELLRKAS